MANARSIVYLASIMICFMAFSKVRTSGISQTRAIASTPYNFNFTRWIQGMALSMTRHDTPSLEGLWRRPCRPTFPARRRRNAPRSISRSTRLQIFSRSMQTNARKLLQELISLKNWTTNGHLNPALLSSFAHLHLPGMPQPNFTSSERWPTLELVLQVDEVLGRLAIYLQIFRSHMRQRGTAKALIAVTRAERLVLVLLCHLHGFSDTRFGRVEAQAWRSASLVVERVVPSYWRNPISPVQFIGHLRDYMLCKDGIAFIRQFLKCFVAESA